MNLMLIRKITIVTAELVQVIFKILVVIGTGLIFILIAIIYTILAVGLGIVERLKSLI